MSRFIKIEDLILAEFIFASVSQPAFPVAVEAVTFEDKTRSKGQNLFDLSLPGTIDLDVEFLGSVTAHLIPKSRHYLTADFSDRLSASVQSNMIEEKAFPTSVNLSPSTPFVVNMIQGLLKVPHDFDKVKTVEFGPDSIRFISEKNQIVDVNVYWDFVKEMKNER
jgi:hypothetical protein